jgi:hypothetical protein
MAVLRCGWSKAGRGSGMSSAGVLMLCAPPLLLLLLL